MVESVRYIHHKPTNHTTASTFESQHNDPIIINRTYILSVNKLNTLPVGPVLTFILPLAKAIKSSTLHHEINTVRNNFREIFIL